MTSPSSKEKESAARSGSETSDVSAQFHIFSCGQGDTILLGLSCGKWALIDCNLPTGVLRDEFFASLQRLGINRLDLVCLTHPHDDHYTGMEAVLRHFTTAGRSVGTFCDGGIEPKHIATLMRRRQRPESSVRAYESLYRYVWQLIEADAIRYFRADENSRAIIFGEGESMQLLPLGPKPDIMGASMRDVISSGKVRTDLNSISVVLALCIRHELGAFDALLSADADSDSINSAIKRLGELVSGGGVFDVIKVSHHGSLESHRGCNACSCRRGASPSVAAVSAGHFDVLPDRLVLQDFLQQGWTLLLTTKRIGGKEKRTPLSLSGISTSMNFSVERNDLNVSWSATQGLKWEPQSAQLEEAELIHYETAGKK